MAQPQLTVTLHAQTLSHGQIERCPIVPSLTPVARMAAALRRHREMLATEG
jgi:hypothetical protein